MTFLERVYRTTIPEDYFRQSAEELRSRWSHSDAEKVRAAVTGGDTLPRIFPPLNLGYRGITILVEDLRGISLSGLDIGGYDLAYCALDYANFENSRLTETRLQYSRLYGASFHSATLRDVQASPIDAGSADFSSARLQHCYFSHSNLDEVLDEGIEVDKSDFIESSRTLTSSPAAQYVFFPDHMGKRTRTFEKLKQEIADRLGAQAKKMGVRQLSKAPALRRAATKILDASEKSGRRPTMRVNNKDVTIGTVVSQPQSENIMVVVYKETLVSADRKPIKVYIIAGSTSAFSVGDKVEICDLTNELQSGRVRKIRIKGTPTKIPSYADAERTIGWILGRKSEESSEGFEVVEN